jgi:CheY-like chemotaxis protein
VRDASVAILIVDDDDGHVELMRRALRRASIANPIVWLARGEDALDYVFARGPHAGRPAHDELVVLLDINMPGGMDGIEVLRQLRADPAARRFPVIMLSTSDDPAQIELCYSIGCSAYVTKPLAPAGLVEIAARFGVNLSPRAPSPGMS